MEQFKSFFGEIVGRNDFDFLNSGNRNVIVQTHNTITNNVGGIVEGLAVTVPTTDPTSLVVGKGSFYTSGRFSEVNNQGGGERGDLYQQQTFRGLPSTPPIGTTPQYLLVYAKIVNSNTDSNPLTSSNVVTSKNLQTGENVPIRVYPKATIVVTNPGFRSTLLATEGVHLALIQVDWIGIEQQSGGSGTTGVIQFIDRTVANNYTIGGSVDVVTKKVLDAGIPDSFLTTRMFVDNSIEGVKFKDNSVITQKISAWDGVSEYNDLTGSGVANQHLKDEAVTVEKINYKLGLDGFNNRNRVLNSSFETASGTTTLPALWDVTADTGANVNIVTFASDNNAPKFGNNGVFYDSGIDGGSGEALSLSLSQIIEFDGSLKNVPLSAFFWAKEVNVTDFSPPVSSTGLEGTIEFLDSSDITQQTNTFGLVSGTSLSNYTQYSTDAPVIYTGNINSTKVRLTIGGKFNGAYYVDGAWLGATDLIPNFDLNPSEYITVGGIPATDVTGQIITSQITDGAVVTRKVRNADGSLSTDTGNGIVTGQIRDNAVTTSKIADGSITASKLAAGTGLIPAGAILIIDDSSCPTGFTEATEFAGLFPLGRNASTSIGSGGINSFDIGGAARATNQTTTDTEPNHVHGIGGGGAYDINAPGGGSISGGGGHSHDVPFRTVLFCRKD